MLKNRYLVLLGLALILLTGCTGEMITPEPVEGSPAVLPSASSEVPATSEPALVEEVKAEEPINYCLECHSSQQRLQETADPNSQSGLNGLNWAGVLPEREPWEKVFVDSEKFIPTVHGQFPCTSCHGGSQSPDKEVAHTGLIQNPSQGPEVVCGECHPDAAHP